MRAGQRFFPRGKLSIVATRVFFLSPSSRLLPRAVCGAIGGASKQAFNRVESARWATGSVASGGTTRWGQSADCNGPRSSLAPDLAISGLTPCPLPPFGKHRGNARRRSHCARCLFWRLGDWPSRLAEGERTPTPHLALSPEMSPTEDRRNQVRAVATGAGRRVQRSRQVFRGRGQRAKRRRREGRHRPDAANHGGCAVSLDRDAIAEGSSRRRARRSLAPDIANSGLTPSDRPRCSTSRSSVQAISRVCWGHSAATPRSRVANLIPCTAANCTW